MKTLALASSLALIAACNTDHSSNITQDEYDAAAQSVGSSTASGGGGGDTGAMADVVAIAKGDMPLGFTVDASGNITGSHLGVTYSYTLTCKDAAGTTLAVCGSTTDSANATLMWSGMLSLPNFTTSVTRDGSWSIAGLQSATAQFDGTGTFTYDSAIANPDASYHFAYDATYDAVLVDTSTELATGGTIHYAIDATRSANGSDEQSFSLDADVTINGNSSATIVLDGSHEYTLNLMTGVVVRVN